MKQIPLSKGLFAIVDDADYARVAQFRWCASKPASPGLRTAYATRRIPHTGTPGKLQLMHRFILGIDDPNIHVDHRNQDGLDNRRCNLRIATVSQNRQNVAKRNVVTSSRFKGVTWDKNRHKWMAKVQVHGQCINLGRFESEQSAALAYDAAARLYFGQFACLNFPISS